MKRFFAVILALILVAPSLAVNAFAAEQTEFVFNWSDSDREYVCDSVLPFGRYMLLFEVDGRSYSLGPFVYSTRSFVESSPARDFYNDYFDFNWAGHPFGTNLSSYKLDFSTFLYSDPGRISFSSFRIFDPVRFINFSASSSSVYSFSFVRVDFLYHMTNISFDGLLSQVVALLPAALFVVVGFVGLRKGVAYVRRFLDIA